jgi:hypothetical protein
MSVVGSRDWPGPGIAIPRAQGAAAVGLCLPDAVPASAPCEYSAVW